MHIYTWPYITDHQFFTVIKIFFSMVWKSLQLGIAKMFMDEHNITQTTKKEHVFFQRWVTRSTIARWSEYAELNRKLSENSCSLDNQSTLNLVGKWKLINFQHLLLMIQSITSLTASYPVQFLNTSPHSLNQASQSVLRELLPFLYQNSLQFLKYWHFRVRAFTFRPK